MHPAPAAPPGPSSTPAQGEARAFRPQALDPRALEVRISAGMRDMPGPMRQEFVERATTRARRFDLGAPWRVRRLRLHAVGALIGLPLAAVFFTPLALADLPSMVLPALAFGALSAYVRPSPTLCGAAFLGLVLLALMLAGRGDWLFSFPPSPCAFFAVLGLYTCGLAVGVSNGLARGDE